MGILAALVFGLMAGIAARLLRPVASPDDFIDPVAVALVGSVGAALVGLHTGVPLVTGFDVESFACAVAGGWIAVGLHALWRLWPRLAGGR